jgi:hypothetical protein
VIKYIIIKVTLYDKDKYDNDDDDNNDDYGDDDDNNDDDTIGKVGHHRVSSTPFLKHNISKIYEEVELKGEKSFFKHNKCCDKKNTIKIHMKDSNHFSDLYCRSEGTY